MQLLAWFLTRAAAAHACCQLCARVAQATFFLCALGTPHPPVTHTLPALSRRPSALPPVIAFASPLPPQMITHTPVILGVLLVDMFALLMYNVSGMCVTGHLGAVFR